jgi:hypothetical protein
MLVTRDDDAEQEAASRVQNDLARNQEANDVNATSKNLRMETSAIPIGTATTNSNYGKNRTDALETRTTNTASNEQPQKLRITFGRRSNRSLVLVLVVVLSSRTTTTDASTVGVFHICREDMEHALRFQR